MFCKYFKKQGSLEIALILVTLALCCVLHVVDGYKMVVLNLFYLPVVFAAFFLGRYRAGVLALLCVTSAAVVTALDLNSFSAQMPPLVIGLALTVWGAVLGLNAILAGTLSDERANKIRELHDAYVGVVEVLARYLNSADPKLKDRGNRISELSQKVATRMRLSNKEIDDIRVAALLQDMENIEVTARVIRKAVGNLTQGDQNNVPTHTFHGSDLAQSLGSVLTGALPLLFDHDESLSLDDPEDSISAPLDSPFGARIIRTVRRYVDLPRQESGIKNPADAINALKNDLEVDHHPAVVHALEKVVLHRCEAASEHDQLEYANK